MKYGFKLLCCVREDEKDDTVWTDNFLTKRIMKRRSYRIEKMQRLARKNALKNSFPSKSSTSESLPVELSSLTHSLYLLNMAKDSFVIP